MRNSTAVILTIVGGVFYIIGGLLIVALAGSLSSLGSFSSLGLNGLAGFNSNSTSLLGGSTAGLNSVVYAVGGFGILAGLLIIFGGYLMQMEQPNRRKGGGILAAVMVVIGALPALGGLGIGFILAAIGCYMGLTYKAKSAKYTVGLGPVGSVTLATPTGTPEEGSRGPLNYCIKCGSRLRDGAVFCGACGARVPE